MSQKYHSGETPQTGDRVRNHSLLGSIHKGAEGTICDVLWEDPNPLIVLVTWDEYASPYDCLSVGLDRI